MHGLKRNSSGCPYVVWTALLPHILRVITHLGVAYFPDEWEPDDPHRTSKHKGTLLSTQAHLSRQVEPQTYEGCDHATSEASFEAKAHKQSRRRDGTGCRRSGSFPGG